MPSHYIYNELTISGTTSIGVTGSAQAKLHVNNIGGGNTVLFEDEGNPDSTPFVINSSGDTGIGTLSPTAKLHIKGSGTSSATYSLKVEDSDGNTLLHVRDDAYFQIGSSTKTTPLYLNYSGTGQGLLINGGSQTLDIRANGTTGTAEIGSSGGAINFYSFDGEYGFGRNSGAGRVLLYPKSPANALALSGAVSGTIHVYVSSTGSVGINTSSPSNKFHIYDTVPGAFRLQDTTQANGYILISDSNGVGSWTQSQAITVDSYFTMSTGSNFDWNIGLTSSNFKVELSSSVTVNLTNVINGDSGKMIVIQDGVGGHTLTPGTVNGASVTHYVVGAGSGTLNLTGTSNSIDIISFTFDGVNVYWNVDLDYT